MGRPGRFWTAAKKLATPLLVTVFAASVARNAWLCDDAYITFRTVDNWINGYGLTWNVAERVQTYTHPLWMLALSALACVTRELFFSSLLLSMGVSLLAVVLAMTRLARSPAQAWLAGIGFALSKAFVDYATSGLENPLTHLLLVLFFIVYAGDKPGRRPLFYLAVIASLAGLNRLDTLLLYAPLLAYAWLRQPAVKSAAAVALGFAPLAAWELFSLFYYGFPFPNTAYAKLTMGLIQRQDLIREGGYYLLNSLCADPLSLALVGLGAAWPFLTRAWRQLPGALGVALYLLYVVYVGGDFMSGRFLTAPLCVAVILLADSRRPPGKPLMAVLLAGAVLLGLAGPYSPAWASGEVGGRYGDPAWIRGQAITDERANYYHNTGLLPALLRPGQLPDHDWALQGRAARAAGPAVIEVGSIGFFGYFAGPGVYVVDLLGLGNPLLARLPPDDPAWRVGHWGRLVPAGYLETLAAGENRIADPNLAAYYAKLELVIRGELFDAARLREVVKLNLGAYDRYLDAYAYFRGAAFVRRYQVVNPTHRPYVYAYVWNNGTGETFMLDDASRQGSSYTLAWTITAAGVQFEGAHRRKVSSIGRLSDAEPLNVGVFFSQSPDLAQFDMYERRFWFRIEEDGRLTAILPGKGYHNAEAPQGYWVQEDVGAVIRELR